MSASDTLNARCSWLVAEALQAQGRAAEFDRNGSIAEAVLYHQRSLSKLHEAAEACGPQHPDQQTILDFAGDISLRAVYLESLGGAPASVPLEDHLVCEGFLESLAVLNIATAVQPVEQDVSTLVALSGVSGATSEFSEAGLQSVRALRSPEELEVYCRRLLDADWRQLRQQDGASELSALARRCCEGTAPTNFEALRETLRNAQWVDIRIAPGQDRLEVAMALEKEAKAFDAQGEAKRAEAIIGYRRAAAVMQLVLRFDAKAKNPRVRDMLTARLNELEGRASELDKLAAGS